MRRRGISKIYLYPGLFIAAVFGLAVFRIVGVNWQNPAAPPAPSPAAATQPATAPATTQAVEPKPVVDLLDVLREDDPDYPTTEPLDLPAELEDAARVVLDRPVHLDAFGNLWITHPRGLPIDELLRKPIKKRTLIVQERILYVHWPLDGGTPIVVARDPRQPTLTVHQRSLPPRPVDAIDSHFDRIATVGDRVYGFSRGSEGNGPREMVLLHEVARAKPGDAVRKSEVVVSSDSQTDLTAVSTGSGLLVWAPWENGKTGTAGATFIDEKGDRKTLNRASGWLDQPIQLVPLADGSVLAIGLTETGLELILKPLTEPAPPSPAQLQKIADLARKLADLDPLVREDTQRQLEAMGPSIFPELEKMLDRLPAEAQVRIESILGQRFAPTIGGLRPLDGKPLTVARFRDGGCVLMLTGGGMYEENGADKTLIPAWIAIRPGHYIERINPTAVTNFIAGKQKFAAFGNEWVLIDPAVGPQRWIGNKLYPLAGPGYEPFDDFVGIDAQRRWVFKSSTQPGKTLILDSSLPDLTPKLPTWTIDAPNGAGWTNTGWPAVKREKQVFVLGERGWRVLEKAETFETARPNVVASSATNPAGDRFDVVGDMLTATAKAGGVPVPLTIPAEAQGASPAQLFWAGDRLFLYTAPGKLHRFAWRDGRLSFEKTFTENLPAAEPTRLWIDPAGRLCITQEASLCVTFPTGRVPSAMAQLMLQTR